MTKMNTILKNENINTEGLGVNTGKYRDGWQQSADGNVKADGVFFCNARHFAKRELNSKLKMPNDSALLY